MSSISEARTSSNGNSITHLLSRILKTLVVGSLSLSVLTSYAAAPQLRTQVPGWYRIMVGDFEVTALNDGYTDMKPEQMLRHTRPDEIERGMDRAFQQGSTIQTSVNAFLVNTGSQLILIDTGAKGLVPTVGHLQENLSKAGYSPTQVDLVLITHMHVDHIMGLIDAKGKPAFPNAQVMVTIPEAGYWLSDVVKAQFPKELQLFFEMAKSAATPVQAAGRWKTFAPNAEIAPGVKAVATGHTPGHSSFMFESNGQKMLVKGDMIHVGSIQFSHPEVGFAYDTDSVTAIASRKEWFDRASKERFLLAGAHIVFPGLGHIRSEGHGYEWVPVDYSPIRGEVKN
ncbi:MBL fold metallo-hydrolase [Undibacterium sp. Xuan67W]|uniref:MBL fold metallo-hydrolase n=1 Tax=Undibacterium sp. Xuan67W TaxID=3413057 RepID=UPI003BF449CB